MGVPSFYRWLVGKYPKTVVQAIDEGDDCDTNNENPNGEFDNLYLDMNGIIHPCFHPDSEIFVPTTFNEVFIAIFEYIDHLFRIVRPRKLLFVAIDGVAPRAKMNQQRARRYRTAKVVEISKIEEEKLRKEFERQGKELLPMQENSELSDSNVITPGTIFMQKLSTALEYYIRLKLNRDPSWKSIMVILSDANVPGEGEHKIMSFIRIQRSLPGYDPNTRHCIYGLDADLIMLALATHEIHFSVLREDVLKQNQEIDIARFISNSSQQEHESFKTKQWFKQIEASNHKKAHKKTYQFLNIWILREYLELDMKPESESVDIERIVDDFIFICFFSGNDFLPHLPSIEIHEGAIDLLIAVYKKMFKTMGGYLVDTSRMNEENFKYIDFQRVKQFIIKVGSYEDKIFRKRCDLRKKKLQRLLQEREKEGNDRINSINLECNATQEDVNCTIGLSELTVNSFSQKCGTSSLTVEANGSTQSDALANTKELMGILKQFLRDKSDLFKNEVFNNDKVKLDCPGWKDRYYKEKLLAENAKELVAIRTVLVEKYVEGLCWVLKYYFTGVCSWSWYYPFYYAPFVSDLKDLCCPKVSFTVGKPFKPYDQLMAVLPPRSSHALPKAYRSLMNNDDSPIRNFYPEDFVEDNDGIRFTWQGVCKLPFIEEELLLGATKMLSEELENDEVERNLIKSAKAFVLDSNSLFTLIIPPKETQIHEVAGASCESNCFLTLNEGGSNPSTFISPVLGMEDVLNDRSSCANFVSKEPEIHITRALTDNMPEKTIEHSDIVQRMLWHKYPGPVPPPSVQSQRVPKTLYPPENEAWKPSGHGWAGRGKVLYDAFRAGPCTDRRPSPAFSAPNVNWKAKVNNLSTNYGRGQFSTVSSVLASTSYNKFQVLEDGDDYRPRSVPITDNLGRGGRTETSNNYGNRGRGRGHQYSTASSVSSSTTCNKFRVLDNSSGNLRHRSAPVVDNRGRTMNNNGNQGRGRGHQNVQWVRKPENANKGPTSAPVSYGCEARYPSSDDWRGGDEKLISGEKISGETADIF